jgi:hypothetical protein
MSIEITCPNCSRKLRVRDDKAGRQIKCPGCGDAIPVPAADAEEGAYDLAEAVTCPSCRRGLAKGAVVCVECGYDFRTRRKHRTTYSGGGFSRDFGLTWLGSFHRYTFDRARDGGWLLSVSRRLFFLPLGTRQYDLRQYQSAVTDYTDGGDFYRDGADIYCLALESKRGRRVTIYRGGNEEMMSWLIESLQETAGLSVQRA